MAKIAKLKNLNQADEFINIIKNKELLIYEDVQGSKIYVNWDGKRITIKPKSLKNEPLNFVDLVVQKFYNQAYIYLNSLPNYVFELLNPKWWFCFEYFPDEQPAHIKYNRVPKNNLILTCIVKGNDYIYNYDEILEYAKLFDVEPLPVVFKGILTNKQLEIIQLYLNTKEEDLKYVFDEDNFAYFFYKILNPNIKNSFLMNPDTFNDNLEKIVIKIDGKPQYSFEILNPLYRKMEIQNNTEYVKVYSLILLKFLEFAQLIDIEKYKLTKLTKEELYVELICNMFNDYMKNNESVIVNWDFAIPTFFKEDKFKINIDFIPNEETKKYIKSNDKIEYVFKCILNSFNNRKKKVFGVFTEMSLNLYNNFVNKIDIFLDKTLNINRELHGFQKSDLKNFKDYFNLKYDVDASGKIYPETDKFKEKETGEEKKDKKGIKSDKKLK